MYDAADQSGTCKLQVEVPWLPQQLSHAEM